jgi:hypothetical protein
MVNRNNAGKLLSFPAPRPVPGSPAENWSLRSLETKDNLVPPDWCHHRDHKVPNSSANGLIFG